MFSSPGPIKYKKIFSKNKPKSKISKKILWLSLLVLCLAGVGAARAGSLSPGEEAALFSLKDLGPVDFSPKTLPVEVYVSNSPELAPFLRMQAAVWVWMQEFYARLGVNLVACPGRATPGPLAPARRLRLEMLTQKEWLERSFQAFEVAPPFRLRFLKVCRDKFAFAHLPLSVVHFSFPRFAEAESAAGKEGRLRVRCLGNLLIHELGHLVGLYHAHEFVNDPIPEYLPDGTPDFMSHDIVGEGTLGFVHFQKRLVHSYLGQGKVYQQYRYVDFDPLRYLELVKKYNGYREPAPEKKAGLGAESLALAGEEQDDDDEED
jgi:hypothetical protein